MKKMLIFSLVTFGICAEFAVAQAPAAKAPAKAPALTAEQKAKLKGWQKDLDDKTVTENGWPKEMCGKDLPMTIDESIAPAFMEAGNEANFYCREVREKLSTICRNGKGNLKYGNGKDNKELVNKLINKIVCTLGTASEDEASFKIDKGVLTASLGPKASNVSESLLKFLYEKHGFNDGSLREDKK